MGPARATSNSEEFSVLPISSLTTIAFYTMAILEADELFRILLQPYNTGIISQFKTFQDQNPRLEHREVMNGFMQGEQQSQVKYLLLDYLASNPSPSTLCQHQYQTQYIMPLCFFEETDWRKKWYRACYGCATPPRTAPSRSTRTSWPLRMIKDQDIAPQRIQHPDQADPPQPLQVLGRDHVPRPHPSSDGSNSTSLRRSEPAGRLLNFLDSSDYPLRLSDFVTRVLPSIDEHFICRRHTCKAVVHSSHWLRATGDTKHHGHFFCPDCLRQYPWKTYASTAASNRAETLISSGQPNIPAQKCLIVRATSGPRETEQLPRQSQETTIGSA